MNWGAELWDQYDQVANHTQQGITFLENFNAFIKERAIVEAEYAAKMRKIARNYQPKKKDDDDAKYTCFMGFTEMLHEVNDLANQHDAIGENLQQSICATASGLIRELKDERKRLLSEGNRLQSNLQSAIALLDKCKRNYAKAFKEAEKASEKYDRANRDMNLSRAEVQAAQDNSRCKSQMCENAKSEYANQLEKTNQLQREHYNVLMPDIFKELQRLDEKRVTAMSNFIKQMADIHRDVLPIVNTCLDGMLRAAESIDPLKDSQFVIDRYKSGVAPPDDFPFEDLCDLKNSDTQSSHSGHIPSFRGETIRGTISAGKLRKRSGLFSIFSSNKHNMDESKEDFADLPPNQRCRKLTKRIEEIENELRKETANRDGILRMQQTYTKTPSMGDAAALEPEIAACAKKIEKLQAQLAKYQGYLEEAESQNQCTPDTQKRQYRSSLSENSSLSRSNSEESNVNNQNNNKHYLNAQLNNTSSHSPESGLGTSHTSIPDAAHNGGTKEGLVNGGANGRAGGASPVHTNGGDTDDTVDDDDDYEEGDDEQPLPPLGRATALYAFDAISEGAIPMEECEEFFVVELDQGDGWTRVRRTTNNDEGFVPTSYLECHMYNSC